MIIPFIILFLLGMIQGAIGWIMVASGLVPEKLFVDHIKLATHFITALVLLSYTFWFALSISVPSRMKVINKPLRKITWAVLIVLFFQLIYGAFMAGLKAATTAPTWPSINGGFWPDPVSPYAGRVFSGLSVLVDQPLVIHFIHRNLAYIITLLVFLWYVKAWKLEGSSVFSRLRSWPLILVLVQVLLGILTVLYSPSPKALLWFGVAHQAGAMLLLAAVVANKYLVTAPRSLRH